MKPKCWVESETEAEDCAAAHGFRILNLYLLKWQRCRICLLIHQKYQEYAAGLCAASSLRMMSIHI